MGVRPGERNSITYTSIKHSFPGNLIFDILPKAIRRSGVVGAPIGPGLCIRCMEQAEERCRLTP